MYRPQSLRSLVKFRRSNASLANRTCEDNDGSYRLIRKIPACHIVQITSIYIDVLVSEEHDPAIDLIKVMDLWHAAFRRLEPDYGRRRWHRGTPRGRPSVRIRGGAS